MRLICSLLVALVFAFAQVAAAQSPPSPTANASDPSPPRTADGRAYGDLSKAEIDALSDDEYDKYQKWKISVKETTLAKLKKESEEQHATIAAQKDLIEAAKEAAQNQGRMSPESAKKVRDALDNPLLINYWRTVGAESRPKLELLLAAQRRKQ